MTYYGIWGAGNCPKNIIEDGLRDLGIENNQFVSVGRRGMSPDEERVFDFLIENEAFLQVIHTGDCPKALLDNSTSDIQVPDVRSAMLKLLRSNIGVLLVLWDPADDGLEEMCFQALDMGIEVRELSNGLAPITIVDETPTIEPKASTTTMSNATVEVRYEQPDQTLVGIMVYYDNGVMKTMDLAPEFVASALGRSS